MDLKLMQYSIEMFNYLSITTNCYRINICLLLIAPTIYVKFYFNIMFYA